MRVVGGDMKGSKITEILSTEGDTTLLNVDAELNLKSSRFSRKNPYG